jgi:hypothetical protein
MHTLRHKLRGGCRKQNVVACKDTEDLVVKHGCIERNQLWGGRRKETRGKKWVHLPVTSHIIAGGTKDDLSIIVARGCGFACVDANVYIVLGSPARDLGLNWSGHIRVQLAWRRHDLVGYLQ